MLHYASIVEFWDVDFPGEAIYDSSIDKFVNIAYTTHTRVMQDLASEIYC